MASIAFHPELFSLSQEHRRVLVAELEQRLAGPDAIGPRIVLHAGRYVAHREGDGWQIRRQDAEATNRMNLVTAIETWMDLNPSTADLALIVEAISTLLARQQRVTRKAVTP